MEEKPKVNLKQYIPQKGKKRYIIKIVIYVVVLLFLVYWVTQKLQSKEHQKQQRNIEEINGVEIITD